MRNVSGIVHIKLRVTAQANLQSFLLNYHMHHPGRAEEKSLFLSQLLEGEIEKSFPHELTWNLSS